ncbi:phosphatidylinositol phosphatase PTPRQ [Lepisosteus oculatus]|uniref:phosphatidylinositol phosphatase PTPRQ n=1 Tax=Lepisosteus oculatus TaxID=7918 RepID=UPI00073FF0AE|nr:PREDICTED: phosphatidylinositol phosphatase PTPRQ-like [Lepisosteus oculatus]
MPPLQANGQVLYYMVYVWNQSSEFIINVTETSVVLSVESGKEYNISVSAWTRLGDGDIRSVITFKTSVKGPDDSSRNISYVNITSTSIQVYWNPATFGGISQFYTVYYSNSSGIYSQNVTVFDSYTGTANSTYSTIINDLVTFSLYRLWISTSTALGNENLMSDTIYVYTKEDVPEDLKPAFPVQIITWALLFWLHPLKPHGLITKYKLPVDSSQSFHVFSTEISSVFYSGNVLGFFECNQCTIIISYSSYY